MWACVISISWYIAVLMVQTDCLPNTSNIIDGPDRLSFKKLIDALMFIDGPERQRLFSQYK